MLDVQDLESRNMQGEHSADAVRRMSPRELQQPNMIEESRTE